VRAVRVGRTQSLGVADPHEVAWLAGREQLRGPGGRLEHQRTLLADRKPAERMAVKVELCDLDDRAAAELRIGCALRDPEHELPVRARGGALPLGPQRRAPHGLLERSARHVDRRTDVEAHRDVRAQLGLDVGDELRGEPRGRTVVDRSERHAVVVRREDRVAEREDLESAGVGEDRTVPGHETMEAAELCDHVLAWAKVQVVGVAEQDRRAERAQLVRVDEFDGRLGADRHERRRK